MSNQRREFSEYKGMWLFAMFDLPVDTRKARREYTRFRKALLADGFTMLQFSVYARYCPSKETSRVHYNRVKIALPPDGHIRLLFVTDRQFGKMEVYFGKNRKPVEDPPAQMMLF